MATEDKKGSVIDAELTEEQKKYKAEIERKNNEFRELLQSPISEEDAAVALAENEVNRCRVRALIQQFSMQIQELTRQISDAEAKLVDLDGEDSIIKRRLLNKGK